MRRVWYLRASAVPPRPMTALYYSPALYDTAVIQEAPWLPL
jgi:hypothetical protein